MKKMLALVLLFSLAYSQTGFPMEVTLKILGTSGGTGNALVNNCADNGGPATIDVGLQFSSPGKSTPVYYRLYDTYLEEWGEYKLLCTVGASGKTCNLVLPLKLGGKGNGTYSSDLIQLKVEEGQYQYLKTFSLSFEHWATALEQQILQKVAKARGEISKIEQKGKNKECNALDHLDGIKAELINIEDMVAQCKLQEGFSAVTNIEGRLATYSSEVDACVGNWQRFESIMQTKQQDCNNQFDSSLESEIRTRIKAGTVQESDFSTLSNAVASYNEKCQGIGGIIGGGTGNGGTGSTGGSGGGSGTGTSGGTSSTEGTSPACGAAFILLGALYGAFRRSI
ncbi:MAG: hypothetical protein QW035_02950 [Candidatus Anstonellales archaeon]